MYQYLFTLIYVTFSVAATDKYEHIYIQNDSNLLHVYRINSISKGRSIINVLRFLLFTGLHKVHLRAHTYYNNVLHSYIKLHIQIIVYIMVSYPSRHPEGSFGMGYRSKWQDETVLLSSLAHPETSPMPAVEHFVPQKNRDGLLSHGI